MVLSDPKDMDTGVLAVGGFFGVSHHHPPKDGSVCVQARIEQLAASLQQPAPEDSREF